LHLLAVSPRPAPSVGSLPSSRRQCLESTSRPASLADLRSALDVLHVLDGFLLDAPGGLVSSHCHVQGSRFRGLRPRPSRTASSAAFALSSLVTAALPRVLPSAPGVRHVALRALLRHRDPLCLGRSLASASTRVPSCGSAPSGSASWILAAPSRRLRSRPWRVDPACDSGRWPSASRSIHDPSLCPQRFLPFELCGLRDRRLVPVTTRGPSTGGPWDGPLCEPKLSSSGLGNTPSWIYRRGLPTPLNPHFQSPCQSAFLGPNRLHCTLGYKTPRETTHSKSL
jgi:hypothetical protein